MRIYILSLTKQIMKTRRTKVFLSLLAMLVIWFATANAYVFQVDNRNPFGVLNLSSLVIKPTTTSTGMELSGYTLKIATSGGQIRVHQICDENGTPSSCKDVSSLWNGGWTIYTAWTGIEIKEGVISSTVTNTDTRKENTKTQEGYVAKGQGHPNKVWKTDASGNPGWWDDETWWDGTWILATWTPGQYCKLQDNWDLYCDWNSSNWVWGWNSNWEKAVVPVIWKASTTITVIFPKVYSDNVHIWIDAEELKNGAEAYKFKVVWNSKLEWTLNVEPITNKDVYNNTAELTVDSEGIKMFWGPSFYRLTSDQKQMRWLSVNWPILAWRSWNYIYMYADWTWWDDPYRTYDIIWDKELAIGTRAWTFIYFAERTGKYAQVITWWSNTWTNVWPAITGVATQCESTRGALTPVWAWLVPPSWWSCGQDGVWTIPERTAYNYVLPQAVGIYTNDDKKDVYKSLMVWVNTSDPQATLDVNGSLRVWNNCVDMNLQCDEKIAWTMMYLERKSTYKWTIVLCKADGVTIKDYKATIQYTRYDMVYDLTGSTLSDLWFVANDGSCYLPKPNRAVYPEPLR